MRLLIETLMALLATLGFGILFNIRGKNLFYAALGGALGWFVYSLLIHNNFTSTSSLFISSVIFSIYSEVLARKEKTPVTTFVICALIPLVPGSGMYYTMLEAITGQASEALQLAITTLSNAGALALGVIFVSSITRLITGYKPIS